MGIGEAFKVMGWVTDRIDQFSKWMQKKGRRDNIHGMGKDVVDNNNASINKRMRDLQDKVKNRIDSQ